MHKRLFCALIIAWAYQTYEEIVIMIDYLTGSVKEVKEQSITIDIGKVGIAVQVSSGSLFHIGKKVTMHIHIHWNQEQGPTVFGFSSVLDKQVFLLIISCTGIGPKIALSIPSVRSSYALKTIPLPN